jgi:hypothetical protein
MTENAIKARKPKVKTLSRAEIKESLEQYPIDRVLGVQGERNLTHKQREFARKVAEGIPKAQAYRDTYNVTSTNPQIQANNAYELSRHPIVAREIQAYKLAFEAEKYRTPTHLKSLLIQQLVEHSLNKSFPPAQRVKCLELIGKLFEVQAFTESKQVEITHKSKDIKARLIDQLKDITNIDIEDDAISLLEELKGNPPTESGNLEPTTPPPLESDHADLPDATHTIPHKQSSENSNE